jgi:hypothetical protein
LSSGFGDKGDHNAQTRFSLTERLIERYGFLSGRSGEVINAGTAVSKLVHAELTSSGLRLALGTAIADN